MTQPSTPPWVGDVLGASDEYAVIVLTADGRVAGWYGAAARLFGYDRDEIADRSFAILFEQADIDRGIPQVELELARLHGRSEDDRWHMRKDGSRFWANGVLNRLPVQAGAAGYVKLLRDRTDIRIRDEALHNRVQGLTGQIAHQQAALRTLVHELRNSMAPVLNASQASAAESQAAPRARMHEVIARQVEVMQRVLQSALESDGEQAECLHPRPVVMQQAVGSVVDAMRPQAQAKRQDLVLVCPATPVTIEVDPPLLQQMVLNLLSNAVKYTPPGGHIAVSCSVESDMAVIRVDDDGVGIAQENLERVFDLFTREADEPAIPGHGIGLSVVKRLAWLHGGFVQARSPGKGLGSQFALQLPLRQPAPATRRA